MMLQKKSSKMARAKSLLVLPLLCTAVLAFAETKYVPVESKDSETYQNVVKTTDDNVLVLVNGKSVKSLDGIDPNTIESIQVIKDKEQMKQYGKDAEGKDAVIVVKLKDGVEIPQGLENCLFVVDGKIVKSIDDITVDMIESMTVIKEKKQLKKYGKAVKGKDGVIEVRLRGKGDLGKELKVNGKVLSIRTPNNDGNVIYRNGELSKQLEEVNGKVITIRTPNNDGNVLILVNGKKVKSIDDVDPEKIESIQVIKDKKELKKYGKAAKGKDGVIEVELKSED